jgi:hypothetical protein
MSSTPGESPLAKRVLAVPSDLLAITADFGQSLDRQNGSHRAKCVAKTAGQQFRLGDGGEVAAGGMFSP